MQTIFLVWLPGLGALILGIAVALWITSKTLLLLQEWHRNRRDDQTLVDTASVLKEIAGTVGDNDPMNQYQLPNDLFERVHNQVREVELVTRKQL